MTWNFDYNLGPVGRAIHGLGLEGLELAQESTRLR
jgi:hypothetical protein